MTTARAVMLAAAFLAAIVLGATAWTIHSRPRYQIVNVGAGETQRLDAVTGSIVRCVNSVCEPLTDGDRIVAPQPPAGFTIDKK